MGFLNHYECRKCGYVSDLYDTDKRVYKKALLSCKKGICPQCNGKGCLEDVECIVYEPLPPEAIESMSRADALEKRLSITWKEAQEIEEVCSQCIYCDTLVNKDGDITCSKIKLPSFYNKVLESRHCRMRKTSAGELSEFEQQREQR